MADTDVQSAGQSDSKAAKKGTEVSKFDGFGVAYRAKLIGFEDVPEARGEEMCQKALISLKGAVVAAREHKQKIAFKITLLGLQLVDLTTSEIMYDHPVSKVSFIAKDGSDNRAFGYVVSKGDGKFQFFGIKTEKAAEQVVLTLRDLFTEVYTLKQKAKELDSLSATAVTTATPTAAPRAEAAAVVAAAEPTTETASVPATTPAIAPPPQPEPKKTAAQSLIDLDIDWTSPLPTTQMPASSLSTFSAWGANTPTSPSTSLGQLGFSTPTQNNDPFQVSPSLVQQLSQGQPQHQQQQSLFSTQSASYAPPAYSQPQQQQQQQQLGLFSQPAPFGQPQQQTPYGQPMPFGQSGLFAQPQGQQPFSPGQQPFTQPSPFAQPQQQQQQPPFGSLPWQQLGQGQPQQQQSPFGQPQAFPLQYNQLFAQQQPLQLTQQPAAFAAPSAGMQGQPLQQQLFFQQQQQQQPQLFGQPSQPAFSASAGGQPLGSLGETQGSGIANPFAGTQPQVANPFGASQQQQQPSLAAAPRPAPRVPQQQPGAWGDGGVAFASASPSQQSAPVPPPRSTDPFADLTSSGRQGQALPSNSSSVTPGSGANANFW